MDEDLSVAAILLKRRRLNKNHFNLEHQEESEKSETDSVYSNDLSFQNEADSFDFGPVQLDLPLDFLSGSSLFSFRYNIEEEADEEFRMKPLVEDSLHTVEDLCLTIQLLRTTMHFGDTQEALILGAFASLLPSNNSIVEELNIYSVRSQYRYTQLILKGSSPMHQMPCYRLSMCIKGCESFCGPREHFTECSVCDTIR